MEIIILSHFYILTEVTNLLCACSGYPVRRSIQIEVARELCLDSRCHTRHNIPTEVARVLCMNSRHHTKRSMQTEVAKLLYLDSRCYAKRSARTEVVKVLSVDTSRHIARCCVWMIVVNVLCMDSGRHTSCSIRMEMLRINYKWCIEFILTVNCFLQYVSTCTTLLTRCCISTQKNFADTTATCGHC